MYRYPRRPASNRLTVVFPAPAGPSMVIRRLRNEDGSGVQGSRFNGFAFG
jgi:hypothetical protein